MTSVALPSARRIAWQRRRRSVRAAWRQYRASRPGMIGLVILVVITLMALWISVATQTLPSPSTASESRAANPGTP